MINRKNLWFLTLFSLILVLGIYYITLPSEIFSDNKTKEVNKTVDVKISENDKLVALRVQRNEKIETTMSELQDKLTSSSLTSEEKNSAFEELQLLNLAKGKETYLEDKISNDFKIKSFVEINNDNIKVILVNIYIIQHFGTSIVHILICKSTQTLAKIQLAFNKTRSL